MRRARKIGFTFAVAIAALLPSYQFTLAQPPTWATKAPMLTGGGGLASGVIDGVLYVAGGEGACSDLGCIRTDAYDPKTDSWTSKANLPGSARNNLAGGVVNGILYAVGGTNQTFRGGSSVAAYDPITNTWVQKASMASARRDHAVAVVDGILYAIGGTTGINNSPTLSSMEAYDPTTNAWTPRASMSTPRLGFAAAVVDGIIYAIGGTVEAYDPRTDTWTTKAPMLTGCSFCAAAVLNGIIYVVGVGSNTVEAYNPQTNTWTFMPPMPTTRVFTAPVAAAVDGTLFVVGGGLLTVNESLRLFTVAPQTITFAALAPRTYGDPSFSLTATASSGLAVTFASATNAVCTVSGNTVTLVQAGTCSIVSRQGGNATYGTAPNVTQSFEVYKARLTVTARDATKSFGAPIPPLSFSISGLLNGDSIAVVSGDAVLSTTATASSPVGYYPIAVDSATLSATNYSFTFSLGTLTIVPATSTLLLTDLLPGPTAPLGQTFSLSYTVAGPAGAPLPMGTITYSVDGGTALSAPIVAGIARVTLPSLGAGVHTVRANYTGDGNYMAAGPHTLTLTVGKLASQLSLTATPGSSVPAGQTLTLTIAIAEAGGLPPSGTVRYSLDGGAEQSVVLTAGKASLTLAGLPVGTHTVVASYSGDVNYLPAGPQTLTLTVILGTPTINPGGIVSAAGTAPQLSPGGLATIFGTNLAGTVAAASSLPLPRVLGGVLILVDGIAAPLLYVSPSQINFQTPFGVPAGIPVQLQIIQNGNPGPTVTVTFASYAPAVFTYQRAPGQLDPVILHADNTLVTPDKPAQPNEVLIIYATGAGNLNNAPSSGAAAPLSPLATTKDTPTVTVGGSAATVLYSGLAPGFVGLLQINIQLPATLPPGPAAPLVITFPGAPSAPVNLWVKN